MENEKKKPSKAVVILLIIVILLLVVGVAVGVLLFVNNKDSGETDDVVPQETGLVHYDAAAVALDEESLEEEFRRLEQEANEGGITLQFKNTAVSDDGVHFICKIGNSELNKYDMYYGIYLDDTFKDQVLLTGLFPPGTAIEEFESEIPFEPGEYKVVLVLTQVEDDHSTFHAQSFVYLNLLVGEQTQ